MILRSQLKKIGKAFVALRPRNQLQAQKTLWHCTGRCSGRYGQEVDGGFHLGDLTVSHDFEIWNRHKPTQNPQKATKQLPSHLCGRLLTFLKMSSSYHDMVYTQIPQWMTMKNKNEQKTLLLKKYPKK